MSQSLPEAPLRRIEAVSGEQPRRAGIGRWAVLALAAVATAIVAVTVTVSQATQRQTAETLLARVTRALFEVDAVVAVAWDDLALAAAEGRELAVDAVPLPLVIFPADLAEGPSGLAEVISAQIARNLYEDGFDSLLEQPRGVTDFFSEISVFAGTIGRLTAGGRTLASVALIVSLCAFIPLALGSLAQARGARRLLYLGAALGAGGLIALVVGVVAGGRFDTLAQAAADPLLAEIYAVGADLSALLIRNSGIIAILGAVVAAISLAAAYLDRRL